MLPPMRRKLCQTALFALLVAAAVAAPACVDPEAGDQQAPAERVPAPREGETGDAGAGGARVAPGDPFPALVPELAGDLGRRPVLLVYFIPGHSISEQILSDTAAFLAREIPGQVALLPVAGAGQGAGVSSLEERMRELRVKAPVVVDRDRRLAEALGAHVVPSIALVDAAGILRFDGASSLNHPLLAGITVAEAIRMAARGEEPPMVLKLLRHYVVNDWIGQPYLEFELPEYDSGKPVRLSDRIVPGKVTAVLYWSPSDPHTQRVMPGLVAGHKTYSPKYLDLISVARDGTREEIRAFAGKLGISFTILENREKVFSNLYRVQSTPSLIVIRPDGIVDSVYTSGSVNYFTVLQAKIHSLILKPRAGE